MQLLQSYHFLSLLLLKFRYITVLRGLPRWLSGKESAYKSGDKGDMGWSPGLGRSSGGGNGHPLQYFCLENPMGRITWGATSMGSHKVGHFWSQAWILHYTHTPHTFCIHSSINGHLGYFHLLAIVNNAEWTQQCIHTHVCVCVYIYLFKFIFFLFLR